MNIVSLLSFTPKIALTALILLTVLIAYEIFVIVKSKSTKKNVSESNIELKPIQFKESTELLLPQKKISTSAHLRSYIIIILLLVCFLVIIFLVIYFLYNNFSLSFPKTSITKLKSFEESATPIQTNQPEIVIFQVFGIDSLSPIQQSDLKKLQPNDKVRVVVKTNKPAQSIRITINNEIFIPSADNKSTDGYPYIDYTIKQGMQDYIITMNVQ